MPKKKNRNVPLLRRRRAPDGRRARAQVQLHALDAVPLVVEDQLEEAARRVDGAAQALERVVDVLPARDVRLEGRLDGLSADAGVGARRPPRGRAREPARLKPGPENR